MIVYEFKTASGAPVECNSPSGPTRELVPFVPPPLDATSLIGRQIAEVTASAGTYGMGGPGFFALRLDNEWLVISIWGAAAWMRLDGRLIEDEFADENVHPRPWITGQDLSGLAAALVGEQIAKVGIRRTSMDLMFANRVVMAIDDDPSSRPLFEGSGQPRAFAASDDLRRAVFLSPTNELWV